jgi:hypothetical protein
MQINQKQILAERQWGRRGFQLSLNGNWSNWRLFPKEYGIAAPSDFVGMARKDG